MRRYGFIEKEKTTPKALCDNFSGYSDDGEIFSDEIWRPTVVGYETGLSSSNTNKSLAVSVSYSTAVE